MAVERRQFGSRPRSRPWAPSFASVWAPRLLARLLPHVAHGHLAVELPDGARLQSPARQAGPRGTVIVHRWRALRRLVTHGSIGFAEAYAAGDWSSPDLTALMELAVANEAVFDRLLAGLPASRLWQQWRHARRANTRRGSRRNIEAHYDLGNDFYACWLDRGMTYSSAVFSPACGDADTLEAAQRAKQDLVIDRLALSGGERVLEIGCGWGGLAERLLQDGGAAHVTGLTLSPSQLSYARDRLAQAGLSARADLRLQDYRDLSGRFDRIVAIEMLEAVGAEYWPLFFATLRDRLRPGGVAVLQVITIDGARFASYREQVDFIQREIFPGGMLPSPDVIGEQVARAGLSLTSVETFGDSYARTLAEWHARFDRQTPAIRALGFDETFRRKWAYYLSYCEAGFRTGVIDVGLYRIVAPS